MFVNIVLDEDAETESFNLLQNICIKPNLPFSMFDVVSFLAP